jgi:hypothetical protein
MATVRNFESPEVTCTAYADLTAKQYYAVKLVSDGVVDVCSATSDKIYGILQNAPDTGEMAKVAIMGESKWKASEALAVGVFVATTSAGLAQTATGTQYPRGFVTQAAGAASDLCVVELLYQSSALTNTTNAVLTCTAGDVTPAVALRFGASATEGAEIKVIDEDVVFTTGVAEKNLTNVIPANSIILMAQINLETTITATTAVKVGLGTASGDPDLYGITADLVKNTKSDKIPAAYAVVTSTQLAVTACATGGTAAGTLNDGTVRVRVVYLTSNSLDDAA